MNEQLSLFGKTLDMGMKPKNAPKQASKQASYIYASQHKIPEIHFINGDFRDHIDYLRHLPNVVVVTDPPFNIGYHYGLYNDKMDDSQYYGMLKDLVTEFPSVVIHYPEALHRLSIESRITPSKVVSWVYNSNTARQHRDIAFYGIEPDFTSVKQPYKNQNDKRIKERIKRGLAGGRLYDWWNINQVKNVSKDKTKHPCQMPIEVMKNIVAMLPKDSTIVDTFMGSGTTAEACIELGYNFVGCEIDTDYYEIAKARIQA